MSTAYNTWYVCRWYIDNYSSWRYITIECSLNSDVTAAHNNNLEFDNRPIEHKPSTKLFVVHIDEMLTWDNQIKHISSSL